MPLTVISTAQINRAGATDNDLREVLTNIKSALDSGGLTSPTKVDANAQKFLAAPAQCGFSVSGANGVFTYAITLPQQQGGSSAPGNPLNQQLWHQIASSPAADFSSSVTTYPTTTATSGTFPNPGATLYWRLRSSYNQTTWNAWQVFSGAVSAGLQSSAATVPNMPLNMSNFARIDSVGAGATATIRIYGSGGVGASWTNITGSNSKVIPAGTIANIAYGTTKFVAWTGSQYQVVPSLTQAFPDGWLPVGSVSVISNGSGLVLPTISPVISSGAIIAYNVTAGGNDITGPLTFTITDTGGGTGATVGAATVTSGVLTSLAPGNPGEHYTGATTVVATGGVSGGVQGGGGAVGSNGGRLYGLTSNGN